METYLAPTLAALGEIAAQILADLKRASQERAVVLTLAGELGAGKTAFVQQLGLQLGITETISSPTFVVMKRYHTTDDEFTGLVHIDAYRLEDAAETKPLHLVDIFSEAQTLICIEWASHIRDILPKTHATLEIIDTDGIRTLTYTPAL
jgi:tRNA threonylcarbamoyl adenosine modification protein YjeE